jgi:myo-inositol 2-dehydrogenase/D-chiro-inositol 1-dehydrogenase
MLVHDFDELVWHCGKGAVTVQADLQRLVDPALLVKYDDFDSAVITIVFEDGPQCQLAASRVLAYGFDQRIEVFGANGMVFCPSVQASSIIKAAAMG